MSKSSGNVISPENIINGCTLEVSTFHVLLIINYNRFIFPEIFVEIFIFLRIIFSNVNVYHNFKKLDSQARHGHALGILSSDELQRTLRVNAKSYPNGIPKCGADALRLSLCARNIKSRNKFNRFYNFSN